MIRIEAKDFCRGGRKTSFLIALPAIFFLAAKALRFYCKTKRLLKLNHQQPFLKSVLIRLISIIRESITLIK
jgi:hypothetical protein